MQKAKDTKKSMPQRRIFFLLALLLLLGGSFFYYTKSQKADFQLTVMPQFMIASNKVDDFYQRIKNHFYADKNPDTIVVVSQNHFSTNHKKIEGVCKKQRITYKRRSIQASPIKMKNLDCNAGLFYNMGESIHTNDHGIGEHFQWINKHFPKTKKVIFLSLQPFYIFQGEETFQALKKLKGNTLIISSVDFSHYLPEAQTFKNDLESFQTIQKNPTHPVDYLNIDADCPACLYVVGKFANMLDKKAHLYLRDSSSTIIGRDLKEENTSRLFIWRDEKNKKINLTPKIESLPNLNS